MDRRVNRGTPTLDLLRTKKNDLTPTLRRIADYVLANPEQAFKMSTTELARETATKSESTIVRFYRSLGFSSYHEFRVTLATDLAGNRVYHAVEDINRDDDVASLIRKFFGGTGETLAMNTRGLNPKQVEQAVMMLEQAHRVIFIGQAASSAITLDAYFKFSLLGMNCHWNVDPHVNAVVLADPRPGDLVFCISHSGESSDIVIPVEHARPIVKVIAITESVESPLGRIADVVLPVITEEMNYRSDAIVARIVQSAIVGVIFLALTIRRGEEGEDRLRRARQSLSHLKL